MEHIIQQITLGFIQQITEKICSGGISDIDALSSDLLEDCKQTTISIIEAVCNEINFRIREDKNTRKDLGLAIKEKDRPRKILTELGLLHLQRDYYYNRREGKYVSLLDQAVGLQKYERIGDNVSAKMVIEATEVSYAKSSAIVTGGLVSRQTVKNHIMKIQVPENKPKEIGKEVKELHVYADEDHVHMQKPNKERGKKNQIVPLVTVTEGVEEENARRNKTINPMRFVDEHFNVKELWKSAEGYIDKAYDVGSIEKIYLHGDGGLWIKNGLDSFAQTEYVMDGYHVEKYLKRLMVMFPKHNIRKRINVTIEENDKKELDRILQGLTEAVSLKDRKELSKICTYLLGNWESIKKRKILKIPGSCTEAQVSHILSKRFSRDPQGWSKEGLGKLTKLRVYVKNGGIITGKDFKSGKRKEKYGEYADRFIKEFNEKPIDFSIFEPAKPVFDGMAGVQFLLNSYGRINDRLN